MAITRIPKAGLDDALQTELNGKLDKAGGTMTGSITMTNGALFKSSVTGDDARNTGYKMGDGQDIGEMNRSSQYYDDRASNCNGYQRTHTSITSSG